MPATREGTPLAVQPTEGGVWIEAGEIPPYTVASLSLSPSAGGTASAAGSLVVTPNLLENDYLRVEAQRRRRHHAHL